MDSWSHYLKFSWAALPNQLTMARVAIIPVYVCLAPWDILWLNYLAAIVFAAAACTDFLDGWLARKFEATSAWGALLDPLADKALFAAAMLVLSSRYEWYIPLFCLLMIREFVVMGLRVISAQNQQNIAVNSFGKIKTVLLDISCVCLTVGPASKSIPWMPIGFVCLLVGGGFSLYSGVLYFDEFRRQNLTHQAQTSADEPGQAAVKSVITDE